MPELDFPPADDELLPPGEDDSEEAGDEELCEAGPVLWAADGDAPDPPGVRGCAFTTAVDNGGVLLGCAVVVRSCGDPMPLVVATFGLVTSYLQLPLPKLVTVVLLLLFRIGDMAPGEVSAW